MCITKSHLHISVYEVLLEDSVVCTETGKRDLAINICVQLQKVHLIGIIG